MTWLLSILVALISAFVGLLLAGLIANTCVSWYNIQSHEGASGFFIIYIALAGGIAGSILGLIAARIVASNYGSHFGLELLCAVLVVLITAGVFLWFCRSLADIPPLLEGHPLNLEVEFRFPNTHSSDLPPTSNGDWQFTFASMSGQVRRKSIDGSIQSTEARYEQKQWIVPTKAELFTERGGRSVMLALRDAKEVMSFLLPLPARPSSKFEIWSEWIPRQQADGKPWPKDKMSCRFRVKQIVASDIP